MYESSMKLVAYGTNNFLTYTYHIQLKITIFGLYVAIYNDELVNNIRV